MRFGLIPRGDEDELPPVLPFLAADPHGLLAVPPLSADPHGLVAVLRVNCSPELNTP
jgi:hypothetical protein